MIHYEILQLKTLPDHANALAQDYSAFGWQRIKREEFKRLSANPDEPEETPITPSPETVKGNQTIYPDSAAFQDFGSSNPWSEPPSPNDSSTYDGLQNIYFKRDTALPNLEKINAIKERYDAFKKDLNAQTEALNHKKEMEHLFFTLAILPFMLGFFGFMGGLVCTILAFAESDTYPGLKEPGIALFIIGGFFFVLAIVFMALSLKKGITKAEEKEARTALDAKVKEKEEILAEARALQVSGPFPPIQVHIVH